MNTFGAFVPFELPKDPDMTQQFTAEEISIVARIHGASEMEMDFDNEVLTMTFPTMSDAVAFENITYVREKLMVHYEGTPYTQRAFSDPVTVSVFPALGVTW